MEKPGSRPGVKVIGAGFGRTGTMSTKAALLELGFRPCYHMKVAWVHFWHLWFWVRAKEGRPVDFARFFKHYQAVIDWPASEFYLDILKAFPGAKVILNVRDPDQWYDSLYETIWAIQPRFPWWFPRVAGRLHDIIIWEGRFKGEFTDRQQAIRIYNEHIEQVKATIPSDKLLVFDVKEGWEPLCRFLNVPIPKDKAFPRLNGRRYFKRMILALRILEWLVPAAIAVTFILLLWLFRN